MPRGRAALAAVLALLLALLAACTGGGDGSAGKDKAKESARAAADPNVLRVYAGSEVADMKPLLDEARQATGVEVRLTYAGTLDGAEAVASGSVKDQDAVWFSSNRYLALIPGGSDKLVASQKIMTSPVVLGVKPDVAKRLGWDAKAPSWAEIAAAAKDKRFTYGMTNPSTSNSGFSALVGVATALAGGGQAIDKARLDKVTPELTGFFAGQTLTSGSSGWLADRFVQQGGTADGLVNYESVLLSLNAQGKVTPPLTVVRPRDGVVFADYPLAFLGSADQGKRAAYDKLVAWLRTPEAQGKIMAQTHRRPSVPGVALAPEFGTANLVELPFPAQRSVADGLIQAYLAKFRKPARMIYVVDTSGSMSGQRLASLKSAFATLAGTAGDGAASFSQFQPRESVTIIPFESAPGAPTSFQIPEQDPAGTLAQIRRTVDGLHAGGGTAIYSSLDAAYREAQRQVAAHPDDFVSIVLMTDGENTDGMPESQFESGYRNLTPRAQAVPTFTVLFGDSNPKELQQIATLTRGKVFDARTTPLPQVFREIRGYQ